MQSVTAFVHDDKAVNRETFLLQTGLPFNMTSQGAMVKGPLTCDGRMDR
jgi:hypothetical protein